jgi:hypothetical protein
MEHRWLRTADNLLVWIMPVDWLIATKGHTDPAAKKHHSLAF